MASRRFRQGSAATGGTLRSLPYRTAVATITLAVLVGGCGGGDPTITPDRTDPGAMSHPDSSSPDDEPTYPTHRPDVVDQSEYWCLHALSESGESWVQDMETIGGVAALPTAGTDANARRVLPTNGPASAAQWYAELPFAAYHDTGFELRIPTEFQNRVAFWQESWELMTHNLRVPACPGEEAGGGCWRAGRLLQECPSGEWVPFHTSILVARPECIALDVVYGKTAETILLGIGAPCPGQNPPLEPPEAVAVSEKECGQQLILTEPTNTMSADYEILGGVAALPTANSSRYFHEVRPTGSPNRAARLMAKFPFAARRNTGFELRVPPGFQDRVALGSWNIHAIRVPACPSEGQWVVFNTALLVTNPECISLEVVYGSTRETVPIAVGTPCPGENPTP